MSKKYVQGAHIRLTAENLKHLKGVRRLMKMPASVNTLVNFILETHGIPAFKESDLFRDATKQVSK